MRDPNTLVASISDLVMVWHVDPETDGTDDSCAWWIADRHLDKPIQREVERVFGIEWDGDYGWFNDDGSPRLSQLTIVMDMFLRAGTKFFGTYEKADVFIRKHLVDIMRLTRDKFDSLDDLLKNKYNRDRDDRIKDLARIVLMFIARYDRPWYKHPKFHFWHYEINVRTLQNFKRWAFGRCYNCKKGFKWGAAVWGGGWNSNGPQWFKSELGIHHDNCDNPSMDNKPQQEKAELGES